MADAIFLMIQPGLIGTGDVAAVPRRHAALFVSDVAILAVKLPRLSDGRERP